MEKDPICGMQVDPTKAAGKSEHQAKNLLLLLPRLQAQVRSDSGEIRYGVDLQMLETLV
jgi:hypothetical protein